MPRTTSPGESGRAFTFDSRLRIKKSAEIRDILKTGKTFSVRGMRLALKDSGLDRPRMAIALKRGYGNAVERNRAKRLIRESFRLMKPMIDRDRDMVFQVFPGSDAFSERSAQMSRLLDVAGLIPRDRP